MHDHLWRQQLEQSLCLPCACRCLSLQRSRHEAPTNRASLWLLHDGRRRRTQGVCLSLLAALRCEVVARGVGVLGAVTAHLHEAAQRSRHEVSTDRASLRLLHGESCCTLLHICFMRMPDCHVEKNKRTHRNIRNGFGILSYFSYVLPFALRACCCWPPPLQLINMPLILKKPAVLKPGGCYM